MTRGQPEEDRAAKICEHIGDDRPGGGPGAAGLVTTWQLAEDDSGGSTEQARQPQLGQHSIQPIGALGNFVDEEDMAWWRIEGVRSTRARP